MSVALRLDEKVVGFLHAVPAFVAVHGVETADNAGDVGVVLVAAGLHLLDESLAATRVGVASVHETVDEHLVFQAVFLADFYEFEQMVEGGVDAAGGRQPHEMELLAALFGVAVGRNDALVLQDGAVGTGAVDLDKVLIDHAARADVEVSHLGVAHLAVGQAHVFTAGLKL